jgi:hypothetical protein
VVLGVFDEVPDDVPLMLAVPLGVSEPDCDPVSVTEVVDDTEAVPLALGVSVLVGLLVSEPVSVWLGEAEYDAV